MPHNLKNPTIELINYDDQSSLNYIEHGTPDPRIQWHFHPEYELHLMVKTTGKSFIGGYVGDFKPFDLYLVGPFIPHNWISNMSENTVVPLRDQVIVFSEQWRKSWVSSSKELSLFDPLWKKSKKALHFPPQVGKKIYPLFCKIRDDRPIYRLGYFTEILVILLEEKRQSTLCKRDYYGQNVQINNPQFHKALNYIQDNIQNDLTVYALAKHLNMTYSQCSRWFSKQFGVGFNEYLNAVRIQKATELLYSSEMSISALCFEVGYNTIANFNQQFKRRKNMTPKDYRSYLKKNNFL